MRYYNGLVEELRDNQIFVFGSNLKGIHGAGSARFASDKGWTTRGHGEGLLRIGNGGSYALPTVKSLYPRQSQSLFEIKMSIRKMYDVANEKKDLEFLVGYTNTPNLLCGYSIEDLVYCFKSYPIPENVVFSDTLKELFKDDNE